MSVRKSVRRMFIAMIPGIISESNKNRFYTMPNLVQYIAERSFELFQIPASSTPSNCRTGFELPPDNSV
jgi:hypothetical protein